VQRLRHLLNQSDVIQSWQNGYRWNQKYNYKLIRKRVSESSLNSRIQVLILRALSQKLNKPMRWLSRSQLVHLIDSSDATVKRELSRLLAREKIQKRGRGRAVQYSLAQ